MTLKITYKVGGMGFTAIAKNIVHAIIKANTINFPNQEETLSEYMAILAKFKDGQQLTAENHIFKIEKEVAG